ncbi:hypothetical protein [Geobacillus thermodenitrificans]|uniref:hypothetical protein n=1 Tax=Geobacillus thermodenitrificans TaxID=33940 RepID=UPI002DFB53F0|nr:hypothetical protein [Geobacillus thermodenitrificans]MED0663139.1 hypothetical protein [Geobacillus thermodenitrificans]
MKNGHKESINMEMIKCQLSINRFTKSKPDTEVIRDIIKTDSLLETLLLDTEFIAKSKNVELVFELQEVMSNYKGITEYTRNKIYIKVRDDLTSEYILPIFAHELGEAHYLLSSLPIITSGSGELISNSCEFIPRINEIFTHLHVQQWLRRNKVYCLHDQLDKLDSLSWINKDYSNAYNNEGERILYLLWALVTFPSFRLYKEKNPYYRSKENIVWSIVQKILKIDTFSSSVKNIIKDTMEEIIFILEKYEVKINESIKIDSVF